MTRQAPLFAGVELGGTKCIAILATGPDDIRGAVQVETGDQPEKTLAALGSALACTMKAMFVLRGGKTMPGDVFVTTPRQSIGIENRWRRCAKGAAPAATGLHPPMARNISL